MDKNNAYSPYYSEGEKYQEVKNLSTKDIAKMVRKEIRKNYPAKDGYSISVKSGHSTHTGTIDVEIKALPFAAYTEEYAEAYLAEDWETIREDYTNPLKRSAEENIHNSINHWDLYNKFVYTKEYKDLHEDLTKMVEQYNFDDSDTMTDYFHVNYYSSVDIHWEYKEALMEESIPALEAVTSIY